MTYDALVVGARCAGAATAMLLARAGLRVLMIDKSRYGTDTLSTHALMRGGVLQLDRWGLLDAVRASGAPAVRATTFYYADGESTRVDIRPEQGVDALFAPRRTELDRILVDAARCAGATAMFGARLTGLIRDADGRVVGAAVAQRHRVHTISARIVIGADGVGSTVAREVGADTYRRAEHASACIYGYSHSLPDLGYQWFYGRGVTAGAIPTHGGHCVFVSMPPERLIDAGSAVAGLFDEVLTEAAPELAGLRYHESLRRARGTHGYMRQATGPGWALVGDAGYFKDPLTAHGITDALRDAELLARAIVSGDLDAYQTTRDALSDELFDITDQIATLTWSDDEIKQLLRRLARSMSAEVEHIASFDQLATRAA